MVQIRNVSVLKHDQFVSCTFCACSDPYILPIVVFLRENFFNCRRNSQSLYMYIYYLDHIMFDLIISTFYMCLDIPPLQR